MKDLKILLVDDEKEFVSALSERLHLRGLNSKSAFSGEEALEIVETNTPDIVLLDLKMPGMDGIEVLSKIKSNFPAVKVIILTGHGNDSAKEEVYKLGAFDYMNKPADIDRITSRIKDAYREIQREMEDSMNAVTFAEAGDFDTAKGFIDK